MSLSGRGDHDDAPAFFLMKVLSPILILLVLPLNAHTESAAVQDRGKDVARERSLETLPDIETLIKTGKTVEAEAKLDAMSQRIGRTAAVDATYGDLLLSRKRYAEAMLHYEAALKANPKSTAARQGETDSAICLALHYKASGDGDRTIAILEHAITILPEEPTLLTDLGIQATAEKHWNVAEKSLLAAYRVTPKAPSVVYALARLETEQGNFTKAESYFREYFQLRPNDASAHYGLGRAFQMEQQPEKAAEEFLRSVTLQPVQTEAYYQLGEIALQAGREEEARANYEKTLSRLPTHGGALTGMGMLEYRAHDYAAAKTSLERAVGNSPDYQPAHYYLGLTLRRLGDSSGAERELHTATELAATQQGKGAPVAAQ